MFYSLESTLLKLQTLMNREYTLISEPTQHQNLQKQLQSFWITSNIFCRKQFNFWFDKFLVENMEVFHYYQHFLHFRCWNFVFENTKSIYLKKVGYRTNFAHSIKSFGFNCLIVWDWHQNIVLQPVFFKKYINS